jgi:hypothetical protein
MSLSSFFQAASHIIDGKRESNALKVQARVASQQALADEAAKRRDNRQLMGEQAASLAESGLSGSGSSARAANQSAALAELDALNIRYAGNMKRTGLLAEAKEARRSGWMLAGQALLEGVDQKPGSRRVPKVKPSQGYNASHMPSAGRVA